MSVIKQSGKFKVFARESRKSRGMEEGCEKATFHNHPFGLQHPKALSTKTLDVPPTPYLQPKTPSPTKAHTFNLERKGSYSIPSTTPHSCGK